MPMAAILTTAGPHEGRGHASRSRSIAEALVAAGLKVSISFRNGGPTAAEDDWYRRAGVTRDELSVPDVLIVDLPEPRASDIPDPARAIVFDDREQFDGEAAVVVQPSLPTWSGRARAGRVLAGWRYAPISSGWLAAREGSGDSGTGDRPHVVVCFGGSDPADLTHRLGPAIAAPPEWRTTLVVGPDYAHPDRGLELVRDPATLAELVRSADIMVLGSGTMKFEVACLGRPAILLAAADDQLAVGPAFAATGAAQWLGDGRTIEPGVVTDAIAGLLARPDLRVSMAAAGRRAVDGRGAERIVRAAIELMRASQILERA
jgi:spore coat polysaccharide biosynthesis predicted glycosyltransferase SpsG